MRGQGSLGGSHVTRLRPGVRPEVEAGVEDMSPAQSPPAASESSCEEVGLIYCPATTLTT